MVEGLGLAYNSPMVKISVIAQEPAGPKHASVEAQSFRESENHLYVDDRCGRAISDVIAVGGSLGQNFVLEVDGVAYQGCSIIRRGSEYTIMFLTKGV